MSDEENNLLDSTPKRYAIQITRPKSASRDGELFVSDSPINQKTKVAKLVLKPVQRKANISIKKNHQTILSPVTTTVRPNISNHSQQKFGNNDDLMIKQQQQHKQSSSGIELERAKRTDDIGKEKNKTLKSPLQHQQQKQQSQYAPVQATSTHHKSKMSEEEKRETREFMKKQREKRKMEVKKDVDKSFVIKQRLEELRKTTKNAVIKKTTPRKSKSPPRVSLSPMKEMNYYSMDNNKMKVITKLKLKPIEASKATTPRVEDGNLTQDQEMLFKPASSSPVKKPITPSTKPISPKASPIPLHPQNQQLQKHDFSHRQQQNHRPASSKENKKPAVGVMNEDLKLKIPDIKLNFTANKSMDILSSATTKSDSIPFFLRNIHQPNPHNFIWAVRKKLEAFVHSQEDKSYGKNSLQTPQIRRNKQLRKTIKGRKITHDLIPEVNDDEEEDESETNAKSMELDVMDANTISEISSIRTDLAKSKSQSQSNEKANASGDDTTISESIFQSISDDPFVGKKRESINSEFDRASFDKKEVKDKIKPGNVSPNTSEKRNNFLSSTVIKGNTFKVPPQPAPRKIEQTAPLPSHEEEEFKKMLLAFNKSLSHVVEVNQLLSSALISKSSSKSIVSSKSDAQTAESSKGEGEYSSSFEKNVDTVNSSIKTLIENSENSTLKPDDEITVEDPSIHYHQEQPHELTSSTTKVTTEIIKTNEFGEEGVVTTKNKRGEEEDTTLNESRLINLFKLTSDAEVSFNTTTTLMESNGTLSATSHASAAYVFNKSSSEIKSWERSLIERTRGQIAWLELQKQHFKRHGQVDKVSTLKRQQRAILLRLDKERARLRENSEKSLKRIDDDENDDLIEKAVEQLEDIDLTGNGSDARENIERILKQREQKIEIRRKKIEYLVKWQHRLDEEEKRLKKMESELLNANSKKKFAKKSSSHHDLLNTSIEMVKSIDESLKVLECVEDDIVAISGYKLNKLWYRLTGVIEEKFPKDEVFQMTKSEIAKFYEEAKERVLESDIKLLLETSALPLQQPEPLKKDIEEEEEGKASDVDTMNSIANIETEEEYPGSYQETATATAPSTTSNTENDDELQQFMANQMKVFVTSSVSPPQAITQSQLQPLVNDQTFQVHDIGKLQQGEKRHDESTSTIDVVEDMEIVNDQSREGEEDEEESSPIQTEPFQSIDLSSVDKDGSIIPEEIIISQPTNVQVTDMDDDDNCDDNDTVEEVAEDNNEGQLIEDISFPNLEISNLTYGGGDHDLSTITECTENEPISSEIIPSQISSESSSSEKVNSEVEQRLISINDSLEHVNETFNRVPLVQTPSTEVTYSTDKDFIDFEKSTRNVISIVGGSGSNSESTSSQITTSTPKIMPDVISDAEIKLEH